MKGSVIWFNNARGYGFVRSETTGDEYFVHHSVIEMEGYRTLSPTQQVEFDVAIGPKGRPQAENVRVVQ